MSAAGSVPNWNRPEQVPDPQPFDVGGEQFRDGLGGSDDGVLTLDDLVPGVEVEGEGAGVLHDVLDRADRRVAGRGDVDAREEAADEVPEVLLVAPSRLGIGLGHEDRHEPSELQGIGLVALFPARVAHHGEHPLEHADVEVRDPHVGVAVLGHELQGLERSDTGDPDLGMGLLDRPGPRIHVAELVVLADELERTRLGPCPEDQVVGLGEALACVRGVQRERVVLGAPTDDHPRDEPSPADAVDHGELLRHARRGVVQRKGVAHDRDADP